MDFRWADLCAILGLTQSTLEPCAKGSTLSCSKHAQESAVIRIGPVVAPGVILLLCFGADCGILDNILRIVLHELTEHAGSFVGAAFL